MLKRDITAPQPDGRIAGRAVAMAAKEAGFRPDEDVLYLNAHGTGTPLNDKSETLAIKEAFGIITALEIAISSTKSMTGHMLGAAGAAEAIASVMALKHGIVPPTIGLYEEDPDCDLDYTPGVARKEDLTIALSTSLGFGGHNGCIAFRPVEG